MDKPTFEQLLKQHGVSLRLRREIRFTPGAFGPEGEFAVLTNKSGSEGVFITQFGGAPQVAPFKLQKRAANASGRVEAIICDFCATWQRGSNSAVITFQKERSSQSFLVCGDLNCSLHVRDKTAASKLSRTQLRENISPEDRIARLKTRLLAILSQM